MGNRPFVSPGRDRATNFWPLAILSAGESWHNLHHADPTCARHGVLRGQIDISARVIWMFEKLGWARNVKWPDPVRLAAKRRAAGSGVGLSESPGDRQTGGAPRPRVRMTGAQRRQQLLDIGRELFGQKGYEATSIEEIAARADVSKPVVYEHFGGKEGLYAVVVDREMQLLLDRFTSALATPGHPRELLERAALVLLEYIEDDTDGFRVLTRDAPVTSGTGTYSSLIGEVARKVEHLLGRQFDSRGYDPQLAELYSQALVGMVALVGQWWLDTRSPDKHQVAAHLVNLAYNGLAHLEPAPTWSRTRRARHRALRAQPTSRAPGTGPCTARTVRKTPAPASSAASRIAACSSCASAATVGPEPLTRAARAPAAVAARSARPSVGSQGQRGRLQIVGQRLRQCRRRSAPERGDDRIGGGRARSPSGTAPAARSRSSSA